MVLPSVVEDCPKCLGSEVGTGHAHMQFGHSWRMRTDGTGCRSGSTGFCRKR